MVKTYRTVQQWDHWLMHYLGKSLLSCEEKFLSEWLNERYGNYALVIGVPKQSELLKSSVLANHIVLSPLMNKDRYIKTIESGYYDLPIVPGSMDLVLVPHTLELIDNPQLLLAEACRLVKPEGELIIFGFNPLSLWGLHRWKAVHGKMAHHKAPWAGHFNSAGKVRKWLELADFIVTKQKQLFYRPPLPERIYHRVKMLDWIGEKCRLPFGGIYVLVAKAKYIPVTPIKLRWKQRLPAVSITTYPGPTMREQP